MSPKSSYLVSNKSDNFYMISYGISWDRKFTLKCKEVITVAIQGKNISYNFVFTIQQAKKYIDRIQTNFFYDFRPLLRTRRFLEPFEGN